MAAGKSPRLGVPKKSTDRMLSTCKVLFFEGRVYVEFNKQLAFLSKSPSGKAPFVQEPQAVCNGYETQISLLESQKNGALIHCPLVQHGIV